MRTVPAGIRPPGCERPGVRMAALAAGRSPAAGPTASEEARS